MIPWYVELVGGGYGVAAVGYTAVKTVQGLNHLFNPLKPQSLKMADEEHRQPAGVDEDPNRLPLPSVHSLDGVVWVNGKAFVEDPHTGLPMDSKGMPFNPDPNIQRIREETQQKIQADFKKFSTPEQRASMESLEELERQVREFNRERWKKGDEDGS